MSTHDRSLVKNLSKLKFCQYIKSVHGKAHADLKSLFPRDSDTGHSYQTKWKKHRHSFQLMEARRGTQHALLRRSVFGLIRVWNRLPQEVVFAATVEDMQKLLTRMVWRACQRGDHEWSCTLSPRAILLNEAPLFEQLSNS